MTRPQQIDGTTSYHQAYHQNGRAARHLTLLRKFQIGVLIFIVAFGVRLLNWQAYGDEVFAVQTSVTSNYKHLASLIRANGLTSLYDASSSTSDPDLLGHPPGYSILLSLAYRITQSDSGIQVFQIMLDALAAVLICLIAWELLPIGVGILAGLLAAFAPQFSWNSILLLPDSLAAVPILLAMLILVRRRNAEQKRDRQEWLAYLAAGALIGLSCWLRANSLLLAPFLALSFAVIHKPGARLRPALLVIAGAFLIIAPLTIRNAIVFREFIPVSLGAGQTLIEGIADYDPQGTLGLPQTDVELTRSEAETFQRPDYANALFTPDGPARDRVRLRRGFAVIRQHPIWFAGVMVRRAVSMLRLERTPLRLKSPDAGLLQTPLRVVQKLFITAIFLPLVLCGVAILIYRRQWQTLALLLVIPFYYFFVQSALHTEYRYVLVIHFFLFVMAAVALHTLGTKIRAAWKVAR